MTDKTTDIKWPTVPTQIKQNEKHEIKDDIPTIKSSTQHFSDLHNGRLEVHNIPKDNDIRKKNVRKIHTLRNVPFAIYNTTIDDNECIPKSSDDFPKDVFTMEQKKRGAVVLHFLLGVYCFTLLAVVCNDYFLPSVERICEAMQLSEVSCKLVAIL